jgi:hypothetical protein
MSLSVETDGRPFRQKDEELGQCHRCDIKLSSFILAVILAAVVSAQQESGPATRSDDAPLREEIQTSEKLLPQLPDRAPVLFELAHDYASLGDLGKGLSLLQECISPHEGFDPEGDPAFAPMKNDSAFPVAGRAGASGVSTRATRQMGVHHAAKRSHS